ncbi:MAG: FHA domain-containing protein [Candidatus Bruticola sp.]
MGAQFCDNCGANLKVSSSPIYTAARLEPAPPPVPVFPSAQLASVYGASGAPASASASPSAPAPAYGASSAPAPVYGASGAPAPAYGASSAPAPTYGASSAPAPAYGTSSIPAPAYGASSAPASAYGASSAPAPAYGASGSPASPGAPASACQLQSVSGYASLKDEHSGQVFQLSADKILLGRGPALPGEGSKIDFEGLRGGETVSKRHAYLRRDSTGIAIEDARSGNGTFINNERLMPGIERFLNSGDRLRLGTVQFIVSILNKK